MHDYLINTMIILIIVMMDGEGFRSSLALFSYSGIQRFLSLAEIGSRGEVQRCFLLDQELNIVEKREGGMIKMDETLDEPKQEQPYYTLKQQKRRASYQRQYQKYPLLDDFLIGRMHWGRQPKAIKLNSDTISRDHTCIRWHSSR